MWVGRLGWGVDVGEEGRLWDKGRGDGGLRLEEWMVVVVVRGSPMVVHSFLLFSVFLAGVGMMNE